jgi:hypothetical protein
MTWSYARNDMELRSQRQGATLATTGSYARNDMELRSQ